MAATIDEILRDNFAYNFSSYNFRINSNTHLTRNTYMEIPLTGDTVEIPVFALGILIGVGTEIHRIDQYQVIAANMYDGEYHLHYKSLDANIRNALTGSFRQRHLVKVTSNSNTYYLTRGLILDSDFNVLVMQSWLMQRVPPKSSDGAARFKFAKPVLRVAPTVYEDRNDAMSKYIINKIIPAGALARVAVPSTSNYELIETDTQSVLSVQVVIDTIPFRMVDTETPSISTTNRELLDIALNHLDELIQTV